MADRGEKFTQYLGAIAAPLTAVFVVMFILFFSTFSEMDLNLILMDSAFFTLVGIIFLALISVFYSSFQPPSEEDVDESEEKKEKKKAKNAKKASYLVIRTITLAAFTYVNAWILFVSPFSWFGGSLFGFFTQLLIMIPMGFLFFNFWANRQKIGLLLILVASVSLFPLSFSFPTLFSNFYILSTGTSAAAGGQLASNYNVINPMSYYKSSILQKGETEPVVGPTYEEVSDEVIGVEISIGGRMCDSNDLVATVSLDNEAKYQLSDVFVQMSPMKELYAAELGGGFDICSTDFDTNKEAQQLYDTHHVQELPKGSPATVTSTFQTTLPADVLEQVCQVRTDVVLSYHTTTVFPVSFMDYEEYQLDPKNIGKPKSTSSFGKIRVDMDIGQQPIPVGDANSTEAQGEDSVLLKVGWEQKSEGIVSNPDIFLFLPGDLGKCADTINLKESYLEGASGEWIGKQYTGSITDRSLTNDDFDCYDYEEGEESISDFCNEHFTDSIAVNEVNQDALAAISEFSASQISGMSSYESLNVPGVANVCEDLVEKGYSICESTLNPSPSQVLLCELNLTESGVDVSEVDMNTYLIRADSIYEFHDVSTNSFTVENCDAV